MFYVKDKTIDIMFESTVSVLNKYVKVWLSSDL